jgi:hypothetical protein
MLNLIILIQSLFTGLSTDQRFRDYKVFRLLLVTPRQSFSEFFQMSQPILLFYYVANRKLSVHFSFALAIEDLHVTSMSHETRICYTEYSLIILSHIVLAKFARTSREIF